MSAWSAHRKTPSLPAERDTYCGNTARERTIVQLLRQFNHLRDPWTSPSGIPGTGESVNLMPHDPHCRLRASRGPSTGCTCWYRSMEELERLLRLMADEERCLWRHVAGRYLATNTTTRDVAVATRTKRGKRLTVTQRSVSASWPAYVDRVQVEAGVTWLASRWGLRFEPFLPRELSTA